MPRSMTQRSLYATSALLPEGWAENVAITIGATGTIDAVTTGLASIPEGAELVDGVLIPGVANCHSHAFQRLIAGLTECRGGSEDNFWSWRNVMYQLMAKIGAEELQIVSEQLYIEMLKHGYTAVAEFHYLHHSPNGTPYHNAAEMSHRVIAAAQAVGMPITLLPVLYCHSDFGECAPLDNQRRFVHSPQEYQALLEQLHSDYRNHVDVHLGIAPHSLRAVSQRQLEETIEHFNGLSDSAPIHIHIAEQLQEVTACVAHYGTPPVAWLQDHFDINARWCLVHSTHISTEECVALSSSGSIAGLCPTTEANLGDGLFPAGDYLRLGGHFAIGSDSQVTVSPAEELRLLEYGQRLTRQKRTLLASEQYPSVGEFLLRGAMAGGAQAVGTNTGAIRVNARADLVVLDDQHPSLYAKQASTLLDSWIFASHGNPVKHVMTGGCWQVRDGRHQAEETVAASFRSVMRRLL